LNYSLAGPTDSISIMTKVDALKSVIGFKPKRKDYCQAIEILFSLPASTQIDTKNYFIACVAWCTGKFGEANILSADVHLDESSPHCHVLVAPIENGKWVGGAQITVAKTRELCESFGKKVAKRFGVVLADRITGQQKAWAVAMVLAAIETGHKGLIASPLWLPTRKAIERDPAPYVDALGLVLPDMPSRKLRTMAQIFTGVVKAGKRESTYVPKTNPIGIEIGEPVQDDSSANPIGIESSDQKIQSLSCVGFAIPETSSTPAQPSAPAAAARQEKARQAHKEALERTARPRVPYRPSKVAEGVSASLGGYRRVQDGDPLPEGY
jgi:hypothetical protein